MIIFISDVWRDINISNHEIKTEIDLADDVNIGIIRLDIQWIHKQNLKQ